MHNPLFSVGKMGWHKLMDKGTLLVVNKIEILGTLVKVVPCHVYKNKNKNNLMGFITTPLY